MSQGCRAKLAPGQWWSFCGETDMGQTLPALCTQCGGEFKRADTNQKLLPLYDKDLAAAVTKTGQRILNETLNRMCDSEGGEA